MKRAGIIVWPMVAKSGLLTQIRTICEEFDISVTSIDLTNVQQGNLHFKAICDYKNVVTWGCYARTVEEIKKDRNVLFLENHPLDNNRFFYMDSNGWNSSSTIVTKGLNKEPADQEYRNRVFTHLRKLCGWPEYEGPNKNGYVLIALQSLHSLDTELLDRCARFLPKGVDVLVRPHPAWRTDAKMSQYKKFIERMPNWGIDEVSNVFSAIRGARAVVTNFSALTFKALVMGVPVATMMRGLHSGTHATLECDRAPVLLSKILDYRFDKEASEKLICSIYRHGIPMTPTYQEVYRNEHFANWLKRIRS